MSFSRNGLGLSYEPQPEAPIPWVGRPRNRRHGAKARALIRDPANDVLASAVSLCEIVIKLRIGKLEADIGAIERAIIHDGFQRLPITSPHLAASATLSFHHRDPFDHMLIAQAITEDAIFISEDKNAASYPVQLQRCSDM
jgi:PIN domain nuclease of toxin-antitoxin system